MEYQELQESALELYGKQQLAEALRYIVERAYEYHALTAHKGIPNLPPSEIRDIINNGHYEFTSDNTAIQNTDDSPLKRLEAFLGKSYTKEARQARQQHNERINSNAKAIIQCMTDEQLADLYTGRSSDPHHSLYIDDEKLDHSKSKDILRFAHNIQALRSTPDFTLFDDITRDAILPQPHHYYALKEADVPSLSTSAQKKMNQDLLGPDIIGVQYIHPTQGVYNYYKNIWSGAHFSDTRALASLISVLSGTDMHQQADVITDEKYITDVLEASSVPGTPYAVANYIESYLRGQGFSDTEIQPILIKFGQDNDFIFTSPVFAEHQDLLANIVESMQSLAPDLNIHISGSGISTLNPTPLQTDIFQDNVIYERPQPEAFQQLNNAQALLQFAHAKLAFSLFTTAFYDALIEFVDFDSMDPMHDEQAKIQEYVDQLPVDTTYELGAELSRHASYYEYQMNVEYLTSRIEGLKESFKDDADKLAILDDIDVKAMLENVEDTMAGVSINLDYNAEDSSYTLKTHSSEIGDDGQQVDGTLMSSLRAMGFPIPQGAFYVTIQDDDFQSVVNAKEAQIQYYKDRYGYDIQNNNPDELVAVSDLETQGAEHSIFIHPDTGGPLTPEDFALYVHENQFGPSSPADTSRLN